MMKDEDQTAEIHRRATFRHGRPHLSSDGRPTIKYMWQVARGCLSQPITPKSNATSPSCTSLINSIVAQFSILELDKRASEFSPLKIPFHRSVSLSLSLSLRESKQCNSDNLWGIRQSPVGHYYIMRILQNRERRGEEDRYTHTHTYRER